MESRRDASSLTRRLYRSVAFEFTLPQNFGKFQSQSPRSTAWWKYEVQVCKEWRSIDGEFNKQIVMHELFRGRNETTCHNIPLRGQLVQDTPFLNLVYDSIFSEPDRGQQISYHLTIVPITSRRDERLATKFCDADFL